jgi:hypothetical protein
MPSEEPRHRHQFASVNAGGIDAGLNGVIVRALTGNAFSTGGFTAAVAATNELIAELAPR